jgi:hypothetical protein
MSTDPVTRATKHLMRGRRRKSPALATMDAYPINHTRVSNEKSKPGNSNPQNGLRLAGLGGAAMRSSRIHSSTRLAKPRAVGAGSTTSRLNQVQGFVTEQYGVCADTLLVRFWKHDCSDVVVERQPCGAT